ncbi:unnamed protein product [Arctia plantaginis]|uniref:Uncharacterized protein n=1 Tax=Arctia plantaginis TaxID=874455 RepID=A0A8S1AR98_ARCPL|nr:unnamed protein product [Arctia plantaginis]CAB3247451.1 unnamed protein product [Arctia plantaginis]
MLQFFYHNGLSWGQVVISFADIIATQTARSVVYALHWHARDQWVECTLSDPAMTDNGDFRRCDTPVPRNDVYIISTLLNDSLDGWMLLMLIVKIKRSNQGQKIGIERTVLKTKKVGNKLRRAEKDLSR